MIYATQTCVRAAFFACAVILGAQALWLTVPEIFRVRVLAPSKQGISAEFSARRKVAAQRAARLGLVRGDLWSELALSYSDLVSDPDLKGAQPAASEALQEARRSAERALRYSPHNSRVWL